MQRARNLLIIMGLLISGATERAVAGNSIQFNIRIVPGLHKHLTWLSYPGFLALALENNRIKLSNAGKLQLLGDQTLKLIRNPPVPFKDLTLQFTGRKGTKYTYVSSIALFLPPLKSQLTIELDVETSTVSDGFITISAQLPLSKVLPTAAIERIQQFIDKRLHATNQEILVHYLDRLERRVTTGALEPEVQNEILLDAYNSLSGSSSGFQFEPGTAESLSDQWLFIITVVIWLGGFTSSLSLIYYFRRKVLKKRGRSARR